MGPNEIKTSDQVVIASTPKYSFGNSSYPVDPDPDVLPYPTPVERKQKSMKKLKIFLLTSKEAEEAKIKEVQERLDCDAQKNAKQEVGTKRIQENIKKNQQSAWGLTSQLSLNQLDAMKLIWMTLIHIFVGRFIIQI